MGRRELRARARRYNSSKAGVARNLRCEHGIDRPTSEYWVDRMFHPGSRCAICGLPTYLLEVYREQGWPWFLGRRHGAGSHPRLTLDHVVPGNNDGGFRLLCHACNSERGASRLSDEEVLNSVRGKWQWFVGLRFLWWIHASPGVGGRLHRSETCAKRDAQFAAGATPELPTTASTKSLESASPSTSANSAA